MPEYSGRRTFEELLADRKGQLEKARYPEQVAAIVVAMTLAFREGHKVLWFGNGGSAAAAQHLAAEFSGRFLRERRGFTLGYTATLAVSADHLIVAQQVSQEPTDNALLVPLVEAVERGCGARPQQVSADGGFYSNENLQAMEERKIDAYVPDYNLARVLNRGGRLKQRACHPAHQRMRRKLRSPAGRAVYQRRKELAEPVMGVLKEQRGMRRFRLRGLSKVAVELALAVTAFNLTRLWRVNQKRNQVP